MSARGRAGLHALRGATTVDANDRALVEAAGAELLRTLVESNGLAADRLVCATFTCTPDLDAGFPAAGARAAGFRDLPMLCATEMAVPGAPARVVRVLVVVDGPAADGGPRHAYLRDAKELRPDWAGD